MQKRSQVFSWHSHKIIMVPLLLFATLGLAGDFLGLLEPNYRDVVMWLLVGIGISVAIDLYGAWRKR